MTLYRNVNASFISIENGLLILVCINPMFVERYFSKLLVVVWKEVLILRMKIRFITEIMRENISYCERIMEIAEGVLHWMKLNAILG